MTTLPDFRLETHFSKWEFKARYHLTASDAESMRLDELLAMATPAQREAFQTMWLGYTETWGAPDLRSTIATTYENQQAENFLCFAGASEGIFAANLVLLDRDSHAIVVTPNYQSHETLPGYICSATGVPLDSDDSWSLDIDRVADAIRPNTRLVTINFPHNPTGAVLTVQDLKELGELAQQHGLWLLVDEVYEELVFRGVPFRSPLTKSDLSDRVIVVSSISKSHAAPGFRSGWCVGPAEFCAKLLPLSEAMLFGNQPFIADATAKAIAEPSPIAQGMCDRFVRYSSPLW